MSSLTVSVDEAARLLGCSGNTVRAAIREGNIAVVPHLGSRQLIPMSEIHRLTRSAEPRIPADLIARLQDIDARQAVLDVERRQALVELVSLNNGGTP